ncbi:unnamed protein product [Eruca vesicaria subsp. sativa]|uniref:Uncharacterized protein n=1 Tax=Eruca vesicaria subsp. sativa TaxID=29727 RepID=A0ABC8KVR9_ERUVS|nr:unnamed protein product [Eruca vesicaria subsp. sativa]
MFAARVRGSLKPLLNGRLSSYLSRNCEIVANSRRVLLDRFKDGDGTLTSLRLQCYSSGSDVGVKAQATMDDLFSELGSVKEDRDLNVVMEILTKMPESFQVEKPQLSQKTKGKKKVNKKKTKQEQVSDPVSKLKLLTEKPEASWNTNGKSKTDTRASSPAKNVTDSSSNTTESSSPIPDSESKAPSIISPSSKAKNKTSSNGSPTSDTPSNHPSSVLVIRISNLNSKTADSKIHSRCSSIGSLEGLARVNEDSVEVSFRARSMNEAKSILEKLNKATVDHSQWTAEIVPESEESSKDQIGMSISSSFEDVKKQLIMRQILVKDLEVLMHSIVHLENHPMARVGRN